MRLGRTRVRQGSGTPKPTVQEVRLQQDKKLIEGLETAQKRDALALQRLSYVQSDLGHSAAAK